MDIGCFTQMNEYIYEPLECFSILITDHIVEEITKWVYHKMDQHRNPAEDLSLMQNTRQNYNL